MFIDVTAQARDVSPMLLSKQFVIPMYALGHFVEGDTHGKHTTVQA